MIDRRSVPAATALPFAPGLEVSRRHLAVAVGDLLLVSGTLLGGLVHHRIAGSSTLPEALASMDWSYAAAVVAPFALGWAVASVFSGAYTRSAFASPAAVVVNGVGTWIAAAVVGGALRSTVYFPGNAPLVFVGVVAGTGTVAFALWRGAVGFAISTG